MSQTGERVIQVENGEACPRCMHLYPAPTDGAASVTCGACGFTVQPSEDGSGCLVCGVTWGLHKSLMPGEPCEVDHVRLVELLLAEVRESVTDHKYYTSKRVFATLAHAAARLGCCPRSDRRQTR